MKLIHLSDLHLGKTVKEFSMLEDQEHILKVILGIIGDVKPAAVLVAGDVFDRTVAPTEALRLFDDFLDGLVRRDIEVFIISGNHDSAERLSFGARLMDNSGVHISRAYDGSIAPLVLKDSSCEVNVFLMPFLKPVHVKRFFPDAEINTWTDAIRTVIGDLDINEGGRNILLAHQYITGAAKCESEEGSVGGADNVDAEVFAPFDYVALGHLHGPQSVERETIRYCGTPLKYSFSEVEHKKTVTVVEIGEKGPVVINEIPIVPMRDMKEIKGKYLEVASREFYKDLDLDDYYHVTLTDEEDQPDGMGKLRVIYPNLMTLDYDNTRTRTESDTSKLVDPSEYTPIELFDKLYEAQNGQPVTDTQREYLGDLIEKVWEGEE